MKQGSLKSPEKGPERTRSEYRGEELPEKALTKDGVSAGKNPANGEQKLGEGYKKTSDDRTGESTRMELESSE